VQALQCFRVFFVCNCGFFRPAWADRKCEINRLTN